MIPRCQFIESIGVRAHRYARGLPCKVSGCVKRSLQPLQPAGFDHHHIEAAWRQGRHTQQVMPCGKDDASAFGCTNAACCAAKVGGNAFAHLHKDHGAIVLAHDQIDFAAAAPRRSIIALQQAQAPRLQELQGLCLGGVAHKLGGGLG